MHGFSHYFLFRKLNKITPDIVHCRSYHATWAALRVKEKYGLSFKIIFDARGLWPEEVALKRKWTSESNDYQFLKLIEKDLISGCDASVSVSETMHDYYLSLGVKEDKCIYLSADPILSQEIPIAKKKDKVIRYCYLGALSGSTWHQPLELIRLYKRLRSIFPRTTLTIVTNSNHNKLREIFNEFKKEEIELVSANRLLDLKEILSKQDFGLMAYFNPKSEKEILLSQTVFAVKTSEYLMSGLPIICNSACGGASKIIDENNLGITYDLQKIESIDKNILIKCLRKKTKIACKSFALKNFNYVVNAKKYYKLYFSMVKK